MIVLGLTGSIGMGKTAVGGMFQDLGVPVFNADGAAHDVLDKSLMVRKMLKRNFPGAFTRGALDRKKLGDIVFADPAKLRRLEAQVHPKVMAKLRRFLERERKRKTRLAVIEVPLLFETGLEGVCDKVAVVSAAPAAQRRRVLARKAMTQRKFDLILDRQIPDELKRKRADFVIPTSGSKARTVRAVKAIVARLTKAQSEVDSPAATR